MSISDWSSDVCSSDLIGKNIKALIERKDEEYCFRLHKERVYYMPTSTMKKATNISRESLLSIGTCFGKFTHTRKFRLHVTCLDYLRSEERRVGKECVSPCRSRWLQNP